MQEIKPGYTRVSRILGQWDRFGHIDPAVLKAKAELGTEVHKAIQGYHEGNLPSCIEGKAGGYFDSFVEWDTRSGFEVVHSELRLYCDTLKITGAIDALVRLPGSDTLTLIDYKTSAMESPKIWPLQGCFYHYLATVNGHQLNPRILFLKLDKDGNGAKLIEYHYDKKLMNVCLSALNTYRWLND